MLNRYQIVTHSYDGGLDEKPEVNTLEQARKSCRDYIRNGYDYAGIFDHKLNAWYPFTAFGYENRCYTSKCGLLDLC